MVHSTDTRSRHEPLDPEGLLTVAHREPKPRTPIRRVLVIGLRLVLAVAVVAAVVASLPELRNAMAVLPDAKIGLLFAALVVQAGTIAMIPQVYRTALRLMGAPIGYRQAWQMSLGAFALSRLLPAGGAAGGIYAARHLQRRDVSWPRATGGVALAAFSLMVALGVVVAVGAFVAAAQGVTSMIVGEVVVLVVGVALTLTAVVPAILRSAKGQSVVVDLACRIAPRRVRRAALHAQLERAASHIPGLAAVSRTLPWAIAQWTLELIALWLVFHALGNPVELAVLVLGIGAANLLIAVPSTPGGIGVVEVGTSGALIAFGVTAPIAIAGVLIARLGSYWMPVGAGLLALVTDRRKRARIPSRVDDAGLADAA